MIPAILSCVFVAYLYMTLNADEKASPTEPTVQGTARQRLKDVQARVDRLAQAVGKGGTK